MQVQTPKFSGPLDLLLQLIRREEMDIFDIDIHKITEQYLNSITASFPDLDSAGDFIRMAALLIYIKSKSLFPSPPDPEEVEPEADLEKALKLSLVQMQAVQKTATALYQNRMLLNRDVWKAGAPEHMSSLFPPGFLSLKAQLKKQPLLALLRAHKRVFQKTQAPDPLSQKEPEPSLSDCLRALRRHLIPRAQLKMSELAGPKSPQTLITFLALLELSRWGVVSLSQKKEYSDIAITVKKSFNDQDLHFIQE